MSLQEVSEIALKWNISVRRVRVLCEQNRVPGALKLGQRWVIPEGSSKPCDKRKKDGLFEQIMGYDFTQEQEVVLSFFDVKNGSIKSITDSCFNFNNNLFLALNYIYETIEENDELIQESILKKALDFEGLKAAILVLKKNYQNHIELTNNVIHNIYKKLSLYEGVKGMISLEENYCKELIINDLDCTMQGSYVKDINSKIINRAFYHNIRIVEQDIKNPYLIILGILIMNYQLISNKFLPIKLNEVFIKNYYRELQNSFRCKNYDSLIAIIKHNFLSYR